jgi:hypothetical protein
LGDVILPAWYSSGLLPCIAGVTPVIAPHPHLGNLSGLHDTWCPFPLKKYANPMAALLSTAETSDQHGTEQQHPKQQYNQVILFHSDL